MKRFERYLWLITLVICLVAVAGAVRYTTLKNVMLENSGIANATGNRCLLTNTQGLFTEGASGPGCTGVFEAFGFAGCTMSTSGDGDFCTGSATLPTAFVDNSYTLVCQSSVNNASIGYMKVDAQTSTGFTYHYTATRGNFVSGYNPFIRCFAYHS